MEFDEDSVELEVVDSDSVVTVVSVWPKTSEFQVSTTDSDRELHGGQNQYNSPCARMRPTPKSRMRNFMFV